MKVLHFLLITVFSVCVISCSPIAYAQKYPNSPVLPEGSDPPMVLTQVELASPFVIFPNNQTCYDKPGLDSSHTCSTNIISGHKVQCGYFLGSKTCEPIHQYTNGTNKNCLGVQGMGNAGAPQWFDVYNTQDKSIQLQYFDVKIPSTVSSGITESGPYYSIPEIGPHEKCTFTFSPVDQTMDLDPINRTITVSYDYDGKHYTISTPLLTDAYNDTRTWQYDGTEWIFTDKQVAVPEFPFAIPVFITSVASLIIFYRMQFR